MFEKRVEMMKLKLVFSASYKYFLTYYTNSTNITSLSIIYNFQKNKYL